MTGRRVEGIARPEDLLAIAEAIDEPALDHVAPVRALTAAVRQPLQQRGRVDVLPERHEIHRVALELLGPIHDYAMVDTLRRALLRDVGMPSLLRLMCTPSYVWARRVS